MIVNLRNARHSLVSTFKPASDTPFFVSVFFAGFLSVAVGERSATTPNDDEYG
eukprot:m.407875 g.407875  ORF g.407875 m.407875 type:complete len:53 (+) comp21231_c2_seq5:680-838(+)